MKPQTIYFLVAILILPLPGLATRIMDVRPVDESVLMIYFRDGEVVYRDDGTGPSAYDGHKWAPGDDQLIPFGAPLNVEAAGVTGNWRILSDEDGSYSGNGLNPTDVFRKSKVNQADHAWNYLLDHWVFLTLSEPMKPGVSYEIRLNPVLGAEVEVYSFTYDPRNIPSEAIHINRVGFTPDSPVKLADLYLWLGDGGPRNYQGYVGKPAWLIDQQSGESFPAGKVEFWKSSAEEAEGRDLTGSDVWSVDFSSFQREGTYRLWIEGVGASPVFKIAPDVWRKPFKTKVRGYYYMRVGEPVTDLHPIPRQPRFIQGEDPENFKIYMTDLDPYDAAWENHPGDTWDEPHFKPAEASMFWQRRLPGNPTNPLARGGHSDALDWDRHLAHVSNLYDMLLPFILSGGKLSADDLGIRESGNGIPDLIDEARNEVDLFLSLRVGDAYAHGLTNPSGDRIAMFQAGATTMAAWANAANCAMLADAFRVSGHLPLMAAYRDEAIRAYRFAEKQPNPQLDDLQGIGDYVMRGRDFRMMAAAFLYNVTGEVEWEKAMVADSVVRDEIVWIENRHEWNQTWGSVAYLYSPRERNYPELAQRMHAAIRDQALKNNVRFMNERPSRRSSNNNWWRTAQNVHMVVLAHALEPDGEMKTQMERALVLEAGWGLGRNPSNLIEMTGMGPGSIMNAYTSGRNDGSPGMHPGHTPYFNLGSWGGTHNGSHPHWFTDRGYPEWEAGGWPEQESHFNSRYSWSNAEFTPRQTMRGKLVLYSWLHALSLN